MALLGRLTILKIVAPTPVRVIDQSINCVNLIDPFKSIQNAIISKDCFNKFLLSLINSILGKLKLISNYTY